MMKRAVVVLLVVCTALTGCSRAGNGEGKHESEFKRRFLGETQ
ncbi:hypothetical protein LMG19083_04601 [Ralstonia psammae]|uniref:Lipoprotein n=1 Tax=Ralstonia psammae TaxID=3058598 RepID=A0ABM9JYM0_9RALS|nr:hypothetical protein LMG19083_04601 [Ralstonia sp. LMG 19083]